jgi:tetratricopeptide (TPR) repeat protein
LLRGGLTLFFLLYVVCYAGGYSPGSFAGAQSAQIAEKGRDYPAAQALSGSLAHFLMGAVYDNFGQTDNAVEEYGKALKRQPGISEIRMKLGADLLLLGKFSEATQMLTEAVRLDPENVRGYLLLAIIHTAGNDFPEAERYYKEALRYEPENLKALTFLSELFILDQRLDKAAETYERMVELEKDDEFTYFNLGIIYSKLNLLDKAEFNLKKAIEINEEYVEAQMVLGFIYEIEGRERDAIEQYNKVAEIDPLDREPYLRLGQLYHKMGMVKEAIRENRVLMRIDTSSADPYLRIFSIYVSEKEYDKAEDIIKEAIRNGISSGPIYAALGYLSGLKGDNRGAAEYYDVALEKDPGNALYMFYLAVSLDSAGKRQEAITELEAAVNTEGTPPELYNYLGYMYAEQGHELDRAVELIKKAIEIDPGNAAYMDSLGWAYYKKGLYDKALTEVTRASVYLPDDPVVREHLGDIYYATGDIYEAVNQWELSLQLNASNSELKEKVKRAKEEIEAQR